MDKKYPIISEKEYALKMNTNESYTGFVEHEDGVVSFVLTEVVVEAIPTDNNLNKFTGYHMLTKNKYHQKVIAVNDAILNNNLNINLRNQTYSKSLKEGQIRTALRIKAEELKRKVQADYTFKVIKEPKLKAELDNVLLQYDRIISCLDKNQPFTLNVVPDELRNTSQAREYIAYFDVSYNQPSTFITQGLSEEERKQREYQKMLNNWKGADPLASQIVEGMAYGMVAAPVAVAAVEAGGVAALATAGKAAFRLQTGMWGTRAIVASTDVVSQGYVNGWEEINVVSTSASAFLPIGTAAILGSAIEWKPFSDKKNRLSIVGFNKDINTTIIDGASAYYHGQLTNVLGRAMGNIAGNKQKTFLYYFIDANNSYWSYKVPKEINQSLLNENKK